MTKESVAISATAACGEQQISLQPISSRQRFTLLLVGQQKTVLPLVAISATGAE